MFFFQAEDGIRDYKVTGVQTCALPICTSAWAAAGLPLGQGDADVLTGDDDQWYSPYAHRDLGLRDAGFRAYLDWELGLVEQLERDGWASGIRLVPAV